MEEWSCTYQDGTVATECAALVAAATTGLQGFLAYPMASLSVDKTYSITVKVVKVEPAHTRSAFASVDVVVVGGDPAQVTIKYVCMLVLLGPYHLVMSPLIEGL